MGVETGQVIEGKYKILRLIGEGGMGAVYEAEHVLIGRRVAVKVLHGQAAEQQDSVTRFEREAQAAARIGNDHILEVIDVGSLPDGARYMVCEFLAGETLAQRMEEQRRIAPDKLVPIALQLLNGLGAAHAAGVVHRDLKPDNIFLLRQKAGWSDFVKIIDFGISKFQPLTGDVGMRMTATGIVMGTPFYLSPEQARGTREADHRSDLYTVGVILYEAVTGQLPFEAASFNDLLFKIVLEQPKPANVVAPELDPAFSDLIMKALARDPDHRFQTAEEFAHALETWAGQSGLALTGPRVMGSSARPSMGSSGSLPAIGSAMTPSTWGGTRPPQLSPAAEVKPKRTALLAAAIVGGLLLVVGISFGVYAAVGSDDGTMATAAASASASVAPPQPSAKTEPAPFVDDMIPAGAADRPDAAVQKDDAWDQPGQPAAAPKAAPVRAPRRQSVAPSKAPAPAKTSAPAKQPEPAPRKDRLGY